MDWTAPWVTHTVVFLIGVLTWLPFTLWEGHQIEIHRGDTMAEVKHRQAFTRNQTIIALVLIVSVVLLGLGYQQTMFQHNAEDSAACYRKWGRDVIDVLDARSNVNGDQKVAERKRDDAVDDVLLVALSATRANPPMSTQEKRSAFLETLSAFGQAKAHLAAIDDKVEKTKQQNAYPELNCQ